MTNSRINIGGLNIAEPLYQLVNHDIIPGTGINAEAFWKSLEDICKDLTPVNQALLKKRQQLQQQLGQWHRDHPAQSDDKAYLANYQQYLQNIGYIAPDVDDFQITTANVDAEIAQLAGPQLVVPVMNARYALNAANARWGSLYDALYGSDIIEDDDCADKTPGYNPVRGDKVIAFAKRFLDQNFPLQTGSHREAAAYAIEDGELQVTLGDGQITRLEQPQQLIGYLGMPRQPESVLLKHHGLHVEIQIDRTHTVGQTDRAGVKDLLLEAALTTIQDCEDSVAAVDADDKVQVYKNWLGLMKGDLQEQVGKNGKTITRRLNPDRTYTATDGSTLTLPSRSLMFVRNVGHLMTTDAVLTADGKEIPEGFLDGMITSLTAIHDLKRTGPLRNSRTGSIYIVKPKMHGPEEVAVAVTLFERIEQALQLPRNTLKLGLMDEERRTSVNLKQCIHAARERVVFINTGFMDRTGDEIHSVMDAGPMVTKEAMKQQAWINAYETRNVAIGLQCGLNGRAQIGKGMWPIPDAMAQMLNEKISHPTAGANCAWVPSPTAATLHALHYHQVDVSERRKTLATQPLASVEKLLTVPLLKETLAPEAIEREVDNNIQGILGYVVRWVHQGVGCSKVPDINNVGLMEDRATLRISSQHLANWLHHGICSQEQVEASLQRMAKLVDQQNSNDPDYRPFGENPNNTVAMAAARDLIFEGTQQPSGYTEPALHRRRRAYKNL
jgi:malate synthase